MLHYIRKLLLTVIPVFFGITLCVFLFLHLGPGTIADLMGDGSSFNDTDRAALEAQLGLDQPFLVRYGHWLGDLLQGDLGSSYQTGRPVAETIGQRSWRWPWPSRWGWRRPGSRAPSGTSWPPGAPW